ncbi:hypothetical protein [Corallibacter sp.]
MKVKSAINCTKSQKQTLLALGLKDWANCRARKHLVY